MDEGLDIVAATALAGLRLDQQRAEAAKTLVEALLAEARGLAALRLHEPPWSIRDGESGAADAGANPS